jgi:hypothetical protein
MAKMPPVLPPAAGAAIAPPIPATGPDLEWAQAIPPQPVAPVANEKAVRPTKTSSEFLFELDAPARPVSRELDLDADPDIAAALAQEVPSALDSQVESSALEPASAGEPLDPSSPEWPSCPSLDELVAAFAVPSSPKTADEQRQQRHRRALLRVLTCRDCFRWLSSLGVSEEDKKSVARMLMGLDSAVGPREGQASVVKDPEAALEGASQEQLDAIERLITPIEDRLLALDDLIAPEVFATQLESRKQSKKISARYGRLLASRRFSAGQRRDRFELIATHLLTTSVQGGFRRALPPDRARTVLEHLIGGVPRRQKEEQVLGEALGCLREMLDRLSQLKSQEEFFDSGYFLDVHGYKVSSRDQLLSPEFVYLSVLINVAVNNRIEAWIASTERLFDSHQLTSEGSPREHLMRRLLEQEEAIDDSFGVKRRNNAPSVRRSEPPNAATPAKKATTQRKKAERPRFEIIVDRRLIAFCIGLLVALGSGVYLAVQTGTIGKESTEALSAMQLTQISPMLARGWILGSGSARHFSGTVSRARWLALDGRRRVEQADGLNKVLRSKRIRNALITGPSGRAIEIRDGFVGFVQGGKL